MRERGPGTLLLPTDRPVTAPYSFTGTFMRPNEISPGLPRHATGTVPRGVVLITGASSRLGRALPQHVLAAGDRAVLAVRDAGAALPSQVGDPDKAAAAIATAVRLDDPPRLLVLGSDALKGFRAAVAEKTRDADRFETLTLSTDASSD